MGVGHKVLEPEDRFSASEKTLGGWCDEWNMTEVMVCDV